MHEMSLCESLVGIVERTARANNAKAVRQVTLLVGPLSCADPDAMRFAFDACARGTLAEGARLDIETPPGTAWCFECNDTVTVSSHRDVCPRCDGSRLQVTGGEELRVKDMEIA